MKTALLLAFALLGWARVIRLNSEHLPSDVRSLSADSIGWWEGDTLVAETTGFL